MKFLCILSTFFISNLLSAQKPIAGFEVSEYNVLYRGYPNHILPTVTNNKKAKIRLIGTNCTISHSHNGYYIVTPGEGRELILSILLEKGKKVDTVATKAYRIRNMPNPNIYWGAAYNGSQADIHERRLFAKYPPEIHLNAVFKILQWKLIIGNDTIHGEGNKLTMVDDELKRVDSPTEVKIIAIVIGPDGVTREIEGKWQISAWAEPKQKIICIE